MSELQAVLDCQVELGKFYNVDLFQRGYYQIRMSLKTSQKATAKVDVKARNDDGRLMSPKIISGSVAVSKTFQILYRKEDVDVDDLFSFKIYMIADVFKMEQSLADADFQLSVELWFTEEEIQSETVFQCVSSRTLRLHIRSDTGLHHHIPVQFDYFHLSAICVTIHATLIALHLSYISLNNNSSSHRHSSIGSRNDPTALPTEFSRPSGKANRRVQQAFERHRQMCRILLCVYESLQSSYESLVLLLPTNKQIKLEHVDCFAKFEEMVAKCQRYTLFEEEDMVQATQTDIATLCGQNILLWVQYLELVTLSPKITNHLAKEHHITRVKRFAEGFLVNEFRKQEMIACFDNSIHGHADVASAVRSSNYYQMLPSLPVECVELDGDIASLPIIFEDTYTEHPPTYTAPAVAAAAAAATTMTSQSEFSRNDSFRVALRRSSPGVGNSANRASVCSSASSTSDTSSVRGGRRSGKLKFIKNVRPESFRRPSSMINQQAMVEGQVATDQKDCTLVGYRRLEVHTGLQKPVELGTLSTSAMEEPAVPSVDEQSVVKPDALPPVVGQHALLCNAVSLPTLFSTGLKNDTIATSTVASGSMPTLASESGVSTNELRPFWRYSTMDSTTQQQQPVDCHDVTLCESIDLSATGVALDTTLVSESCHDDVSSLTAATATGSKLSDGLAASDTVRASEEHRTSSGNFSSAAISRDTGILRDNDDVPTGTRSESVDRSDSSESSPSMSGRLNDISRSTELSSRCDVAEDSGNGSQSEISGKSTDNHSVCETVSLTCVDVPIDSTLEVRSQTIEQASLSNTERVATLVQSEEFDDLDFLMPVDSEQYLMMEDDDSSARDAAVIRYDEEPKCDPTNQNQGREPVEVGKTSLGDVEMSRIGERLSRGGVADKYAVDNDQYMSGQCTLLELIKEDNERKGKDLASIGERLAGDSSSNRYEPAYPINGLTLPEDSPQEEFAEATVDTPEQATTKRLIKAVRDETVRFASSKEALRKQLNFAGHFYSDFPGVTSIWPYFSPTNVMPRAGSSPEDGIHLVVCVHGLDGNSTDLRLVRTYLELALPNGRLDFLMSERNQTDTFADFEVMTDRLVQEILYHIDLYGIKPTRISFIGHSLGNLIIRSALSRPLMAELLPKLHTFLSLSGPHLGTLFNSSGLVNMGMWLMQKWKKSGSLLQLSMKDHSDLRQTFLYKLSEKTGLEFFRNILLVGSQQDRYVPYHSSRIELCKAAQKDSSGLGAVYTEMVNNILQPIIYKSDINFVRYDVYHALPSSATNNLIGRAAHIAVLDSELFIEKFITVAALKYFL